MNFVLVGDDFPAAQTLKLLRDFDVRVLLAFSSPQPERSAKVKSLAEAGKIPFYSSDLLKGPAGLALLSSRPFDWLININSTVLLPQAALGLPRAGALNMHPGLLPEYAGLHTHQWALRNGETEFGATIHFMEPKVDVGDIVLQRRFPIEPGDTGMSLFYKCIREGTLGMRDVVQKILADEPLPRTPQDLSRYHLYRHRDALDGRIDWRWPAGQVERFVRAGNYAPFVSPTYTAHLDPLPGVVIEVLKVTPAAAPGKAAPGSVFVNDTDKPPLVACGAGEAVRLEQTRLRGGTKLLTPAELQQLIASGTRLPGREDAP